MASDVILAIRRINDRAKGLVKNLGVDNPIVQDYFSRMESLVPDDKIRFNDEGIPQIVRSADFEKMGYTADRDFNLDKFEGIQDLRKKYQDQWKKAKKEMKDKKDIPTKDQFIASMGDLQGNIPLLYENKGKKGVQDAINTLRKSRNTYEELIDVVNVIKDLEGDADDSDNSESIGSHTITFD
jgi:hypothetical protein